MAGSGLALLAVFGLLDLVDGRTGALLVELAIAAALVVGPLLIRRGWTFTGRVVVLLVGNAAVFADAMLFARSSGAELPFLPLVTLPLLLFGVHRPVLVAVGTALPVGLFVLSVTYGDADPFGIDRLPVAGWNYVANATAAMVLSFAQGFWLAHGYRRAEAELRDLHHRRLERILDSGLVAVARSVDGIVRAANPAFLELVGATPEEIATGLSYTAFTAPEDLEKVVRGAEEAMRNGTCPAFSRTFVRRDGTRVPALTRFARLDGDPTEIVSFSLDVSAQHLADRQERLLAEARLAVQTRDELAAITAHELRAPIAAIGLQLGILRRVLGRAPDGDPALVGRILEIERTLGQLRRVVDTLHEVGRFRSGQLDLRPEPVDLRPLVERVITALEATHPGGGARISVECSGPVRGHWDPTRLEQAVTNLLSNALKYGRGRPVRVRLAHVGSHARIEVSDEGDGIPPEFHAHLFRPFERAPEHRGRIDGLGLGLYVVHQIVTAHGGTISLRSEPGQGSTFTVELPVA